MPGTAVIIVGQQQPKSRKIPLEGGTKSGTASEALYLLTQEDVNNGLSIDKSEFDLDAWNAKVKGHKEQRDSHEVARKYVRVNLQRLDVLVGEKQSEIDARLRAAGQRSRLVIGSTGSRGRHSNYYYLALEPCDGEDEPEFSSEPIPDQFAHYRVHQLHKPAFWAKPFCQFPMEGTPLWLLVSGFAVVGAFVIAFVISALFLSKEMASTVFVTAAVVISIGWSLFGCYYRISDTSIEIAPDWLLNRHNLHAQIEMLRTERRRKNGRWIREVRMVSYRAECPSCGGEINVCAGKREFRGRLIGVCRESSREHLFSFDHISRIGVPLRSNAYYGKAKS